MCPSVCTAPVTIPTSIELRFKESQNFSKIFVENGHSNCMINLSLRWIQHLPTKTSTEQRFNSTNLQFPHCMLVIGRIPLHPLYITSIAGELDSRGGNPAPLPRIQLCSPIVLPGVSVPSFALGHQLNLTFLCFPLPLVEINYKEVLLHFHIVWYILEYRVIHKSLRDFRTRLRNNKNRHGRKEHINR